MYHLGQAVRKHSKSLFLYKSTQGLCTEVLVCLLMCSEHPHFRGETTPHCFFRPWCNFCVCLFCASCLFPNLCSPNAWDGISRSHLLIPWNYESPSVWKSSGLSLSVIMKLLVHTELCQQPLAHVCFLSWRGSYHLTADLILSPNSLLLWATYSLMQRVSKALFLDSILSSSLCIHSLSSSLPTSMPLNPSYGPAGPSLTQDLLLTLSVSPACPISSLSTWVALIIFSQSEWCFIPTLRFFFPTFFLVTPQFSQVARKQNV